MNGQFKYSCSDCGKPAKAETCQKCSFKSPYKQYNCVVTGGTKRQKTNHERI